MSAMMGIGGYATDPTNTPGSGFGAYFGGKRSRGSYGGDPQGDMLQTAATRYSDEARQLKKEQARQMRELLRDLQQSREEKENPYAVKKEDALSGLLGLSETGEDDEVKKKDPVRYNDKEVAAKIQRAKTSVSAGQAVLSAKRKVLEVKRKIATGKGDPEELQLALTHAKRMEIVAKKKKNHLELEELVEHTQAREERMDEMEKASSDLKNFFLSQAGDEITRKEDEIFEKREDMIREAAESQENLSKETMDELNELIAEFGEEELKQLEEATEFLGDMEFVNPHMSREDLENLKKKHRLAENREIVKANMEYLKDMIRHQMEGAKMPQGVANAGTNGFSQTVPSLAGIQGMGAGMSGMGEAGGAVIDVQV